MMSQLLKQVNSILCKFLKLTSCQDSKSFNARTYAVFSLINIDAILIFIILKTWKKINLLYPNNLNLS